MMRYNETIRTNLKKTCGGLLALSVGAALLTSTASAQIFWTNDGGFGAGAVEAGSIWRMELDGSDPTEVISNLNRPIGIALDEENGHIYWAEDGIGDMGQPSRISRANLDGSEIEILFDEQNDGFTNAQKLVLVGDTLYWADHFMGIIKGNTDGTGYEVLGGGGGFDINYTAIGFHEGLNKIYYGEPNGSIGLYRMDLDGQNDEWVHSPMVALDWSFNTLAIDPEDEYVYYGDVNQNTVRRRGTDGSNEVVIAADAPAVHGLTLAGGEIYWAGRDLGAGTGVIGRVAVEEGSTSVILADGLPTASAFGIAVILTSPGTTFETWIAEFDLDPSVSGPNDDPDGDGVGNLLEYALNGDPTQPSSATLPSVDTQEVSEETYLTLTHLRRLGGDDDGEGGYAVDDITYTVRFSSDLLDWEGSEAVFVSATEEGAPAGFEFATFRAPVAASQDDSQFLRLLVENGSTP